MFPQLTARVSAVVGRNTPTSATSDPTSAFISDDFPEPVDPASATTVCSPQRRRWPARSKILTARPVKSSGTRPRVTSISSVRQFSLECISNPPAW